MTLGDHRPGLSNYHAQRMPYRLLGDASARPMGDPA